MNIQKRHEQVDITWLKEHPRQREFFAETSAPELEELAADLKARGQQEPIHCCSDGTIIRGHRRVRAAELLGWMTISAVIRDEHSDPNQREVVNELITDNLMRRQLDDISLARCYRHLKESGAVADLGGSGDTRDLLAARLKSGKSGRTLDRLERLLDLPRDIQDMIARGTLTKAHGEKILQLSQTKRETLIASLSSGTPVRDVLRCHGIIQSATQKTPNQLGHELLTFFHAHVERLDRCMQQLDRVQIRGGEALTVLNRAVDFLIAWRDRKHKLYQQSVDSVRANCIAVVKPDSLTGERGK